MNHKHYANLDALRGVAALMVAVGHAYIAVIFGGEDRIWTRLLWEIHGLQAQFAKIILFFANGGAGVTLFFVLSGVVLGISLDADNNSAVRKYGSFLIKRAFRIYPAHLFVLLVVCVFLFSGLINPGTFSLSSTWYNWFYRKLPDFSTIFRNALLLNSSLNVVTWTLSVEVAIAIVFPMLYALSRIKSKPAIIQSSLLFCFALLPHAIARNAALSYLYDFYLGLLVSLYGLRIEKYLMKIPGILLLGIFALLAERQLSHGGYIGYGVPSSLGAVIIILYCMHSNESIPFFRNSLVKNLGKCSYSFYLWHFPVLWFLYYGIHVNARLDQLLVRHTFLVATLACFSSVALAYFLAIHTYSFIEARFIALGSRLASQTYPAMMKGFHSFFENGESV